jgi:flagellar biosynthesis GTPase FlhF
MSFQWQRKESPKEKQARLAKEKTEREERLAKEQVEREERLAKEKAEREAKELAEKQALHNIKVTFQQENKDIILTDIYELLQSLNTKIDNLQDQVQNIYTKVDILQDQVQDIEAAIGENVRFHDGCSSCYGQSTDEFTIKEALHDIKNKLSI